VFFGNKDKVSYKRGEKIRKKKEKKKERIQTFFFFPLRPHLTIPDLVTFNQDWVSRCEAGFLTYFNFTYNSRDTNKQLIKLRLLQLNSVKSGDAIKGILRQDIPLSLHFISFQVYQTHYDTALNVFIVLRSGLTFLVEKTIVERGFVRVDLDGVEDPRKERDRIGDWRSEVMEFQLVPTMNMNVLKLGCFGFIIKL